MPPAAAKQKGKNLFRRRIRIFRRARDLALFLLVLLSEHVDFGVVPKGALLHIGLAAELTEEWVLSAGGGGGRQQQQQPNVDLACFPLQSDDANVFRKAIDGSVMQYHI